MGRLLVYAVLALIVWKMASGRWPWEPKVSTRAQAVFRARTLLGVRAGADRAEIIEAHKRLLALVRTRSRQ